MVIAGQPRELDVYMLVSRLLCQNFKGLSLLHMTCLGLSHDVPGVVT